MLGAPNSGSLDIQDAAMIFQNAPSAKSGIIAAAGSIFFDQSTLKMLVDQRFEYQHSGSTQNNDVSIFKSMEILMSDRASLPDNYMAQSDFMEMIKLAIRGECNPQDLLTQCKFFSILTLKQILCQLLVNLVGTDDSEKKHKSMSIILHSTI
jgi:hypothetical protein